MKEPEIVALIFSSGKIVCAGAKEESQLQTCLDHLISFFDINYKTKPREIPSLTLEANIS